MHELKPSPWHQQTARIFLFTWSNEIMDDLLPFLANAQENIITELNMDESTQAQLQGHRLDIDRCIALSILVERCTWAGVDLCAQELASAAL